MRLLVGIQDVSGGAQENNGVKCFQVGFGKNIRPFRMLHLETVLIPQLLNRVDSIRDGSMPETLGFREQQYPGSFIVRFGSAASQNRYTQIPDQSINNRTAPESEAREHIS